MEEMVISGPSSAGCYVVKGASGAGTRNVNAAAGSEEAAAGGGGGSKCGRWNPTAEQVKVLTELFRAGLRTPSTEQIQRISSHLGAFGKIESKNVFYWFQNHKARERLHHKKRRRDTAPPVAMGHYYDARSADGGDLLFTARPPEQSTRSTKRSADAPVSRLTINMPFSEEQLGGSVGDQLRRETLELFPLSSYEAPVIRAERSDEPLLFSLGIGGVDDDQLPPLDLRLSSL